MAALIQAKLSPASAVVAMTTGRRYGGSDALAAGLVDATASAEALTTKAIDIVAPIGPKNPAHLAPSNRRCSLQWSPLCTLSARNDG